MQAKVGISYVSTANAELNWQTENPGWNFDAVKAAAQSSWDQLLGKIKVSGGTYSQTQEFYSLLYKDFLQPNVTSDVNGQFMGADEKVHTLAAGQTGPVRHLLRLGHLPLARPAAGHARPVGRIRPGAVAGQLLLGGQPPPAVGLPTRTTTT